MLVVWVWKAVFFRRWRLGRESRSLRVVFWV